MSDNNERLTDRQKELRRALEEINKKMATSTTSLKGFVDKVKDFLAS